MNIANLLKYCPKGTKLYSLIHGEVTLDEVDVNSTYPITVVACKNSYESFSSEGLLYKCYPDSECILFPSKEQRDWNEFRIPVKRGDIMMEVNGSYTFIANGRFDEHNWPIHICGVSGSNIFLTNDKEEDSCGWTSEFYIPASEEAKKELFDKMAEAGYRWNDETLELEKKPIFKEGDVAVDESGNLYLVHCQNETYIQFYCMLYTQCNSLVANAITMFPKEHFFRLANNEETEQLKRVLKSKFYRLDIVNHWLVKNELKPFDKVLVRDDIKDKWSINLFSYYDKEELDFPYICQNGGYYYCIPYEGNEHLLGTSNPEQNN